MRVKIRDLYTTVVTENNKEILELFFQSGDSLYDVYPEEDIAPDGPDIYFDDEKEAIKALYKRDDFIKKLVWSKLVVRSDRKRAIRDILVKQWSENKRRHQNRLSLSLTQIKKRSI